MIWWYVLAFFVGCIMGMITMMALMAASNDRDQNYQSGIIDAVLKQQMDELNRESDENDHKTAAGTDGNR